MVIMASGIARGRARCHLAAFVSHTNFYKPASRATHSWGSCDIAEDDVCSTNACVSTGFTDTNLSQRNFSRCKIVASFAQENS